jgi:DMSO/TMAO reductase YedYZ molybdopterin-dependent catalytic subunit
VTTSFDRQRPPRHIDRRTLLRAGAVAAFPLVAGRFPWALLHAANEKPALIEREADPVNLEFPFASLNSFLTPNDLFYVRNHFAQPKVDIKSWRLQVVGALKKPVTLTFDDLQAMKSSTLAVTLECAGNGRAFLDPKTKGVQWQLGAVSTAEWTGVPLAAVLERAGVKPEAVDVVLEGADQGEVKNEPKPTGPLHFARGLPLAKAQKPEVLLAYQMNGAALSPAHGFPLRAIVGGWYGMASVKWLTRIVAFDWPFHGYDQTTDYAIWERRDGLPSLTPLGAMEIKGSIAQPSAGAKIPARTPYRVHGAAWAGEEAVAKVEVSVDGGTSWQTARLIDKPAPLVWCRWEHTWQTPALGKQTLLARATDQRGRVQPLKRDPDRRNYAISHVVPVEVNVID